MSITIFSIIMAASLSAVFILAIHFLRNKNFFLRRFGVSTVLFLYAACIFRTVFAFEMPYTVPLQIPQAGGDRFRILRYDTLQVAGQAVNCFQVFALVWLLGILISLVHFLIEQISATKKLKQYYPCQDPQVLAVFSNVREEAPRKPTAQIHVSPDIDIPMSVGYIHKRIFLPAHTYSDRELYYVLKHEYTHLRHCDLYVKLLVRIFCCVFWWNPAVYQLKVDVAQMLEIKCDRAVTLHFSQEEKIAYLKVIVKLMDYPDADSQKGTRANAIQMFSKKGKGAKERMKERFSLVMTPITKTKKLYQALLFSLSLMVLLFSYAFVVQPAYDPPPEDIYTHESVQEFTNPNEYILKHKDGTYSAVTVDGFKYPLKESTVKVFVEIEKLEIREE